MCSILFCKFDFLLCSWSLLDFNCWPSTFLCQFLHHGVSATQISSLNIQFLPCISWQTNSLDILSLAIHFTISSFLDLAHNSVLPYQHTLSTMHLLDTLSPQATFFLDTHTLPCILWQPNLLDTPIHSTISNFFFRHTLSTHAFQDNQIYCTHPYISPWATFLAIPSLHTCQLCHMYSKSLCSVDWRTKGTMKVIAQGRPLPKRDIVDASTHSWRWK